MDLWMSAMAFLEQIGGTIGGFLSPLDRALAALLTMWIAYAVLRRFGPELVHPHGRQLVAVLVLTTFLIPFALDSVFGRGFDSHGGWSALFGAIVGASFSLVGTRLIRRLERQR